MERENSERGMRHRMSSPELKSKTQAQWCRRRWRQADSQGSSASRPNLNRQLQTTEGLSLKRQGGWLQRPTVKVDLSLHMHMHTHAHPHLCIREQTHTKRLGRCVSNYLWNRNKDEYFLLSRAHSPKHLKMSIIYNQRLKGFSISTGG